MNRYFDMTTYAQKYMAHAITKLGLSVLRKNGAQVWLQNEHCIIILENIENDYVRFNFCRPNDSEKQWEFVEYLNVAFELKGRFLRPLPPDAYASEAKFVFMLEKYDELLAGGYFDKPLNGDFSWSQDYMELQLEEKRLSRVRHKLEAEGHPEADAISDKYLDGDYTWMDDVRRILAQRS